MGAGMILQPVVDAVIDEAMDHISDTASIKRMSTKFGVEFTNQQASTVSRSLRTSGYDELMNSDSFMTKIGKDGYKDVFKNNHRTTIKSISDSNHFELSTSDEVPNIINDWLQGITRR